VKVYVNDKVHVNDSTYTASQKTVPVLFSE